MTIHTDRQAVVKVLRSYVFDPKLIWEYRRKLNEVSKKNKLIDFPERVHSLAKNPSVAELSPLKRP